MGWIINELEGDYQFTSSILASPIVYNAEDDTITVGARPEQTRTLAEFLGSFAGAAEWRKAIGNILGLPTVAPGLGWLKTTEFPNPLECHVDITRGGRRLRISHECLPEIPRIRYTLDLETGLVTMDANAGYTAPRAYWDSRVYFVNSIMPHWSRALEIMQENPS